MQKLLQQHSGLFFAPLALVVINDASARCKKMAALAIKALLAQLNADQQNSLFGLVHTWLNAEKVELKASGGQTQQKKPPFLSKMPPDL